MMRLTTPLLLVLALLACRSPAANEIEADRVVFFVNADIITKFDLQSRLEQVMLLAQARGQQMPRGRELQMLRYQLAQGLIEETLLVQEFDNLQLPIDEEEIRRDVFRRDPGAAGRRLKDLEEEVQRVIRQRKTDFIVRFFAARRPRPAPAELFAMYKENIVTYTQPGRLRPLQILMLPPQAPPTVAEMQFMLRDVQRFPALQPALTAELRQAYRDADPGSPELRQVFVDLASSILTLAETVDIDDISAVFLEKVTEIHGRLNAQDVDPEKTLNRIHKEVSALPVAERAAAFQQAAQEWSQGALADKGGDMGWIELGDNPTLDHLWEPLAIGELAPVTQSGNAWILVLLKDKKETNVKPFNAVAAELEAEHHQRMMIETRAELLNVLRERAIIKPVDAPPKPEPLEADSSQG